MDRPVQHLLHSQPTIVLYVKSQKKKIIFFPTEKNLKRLEIFPSPCSADPVCSHEQQLRQQSGCDHLQLYRHYLWIWRRWLQLLQSCGRLLRK